MLSKLGLAAAIIAVGSFATIDLAEAKHRDGLRHNKPNSAAGDAKRAKKASRRKKKNNAAQNTARRNREENRQRNIQTAAARPEHEATSHLGHAPQPQIRRKKKKKGWKKFARIVRKVARTYVASRPDNYRSHDHHIVRELPRGRHFERGFRRDRWSRGHGHARQRNLGIRCVAVARRGRGYGRRIGIRAEGFGRRVCRKAVRRCENRLYNQRQSRGRNPYATCVVAHRG